MDLQDQRAMIEMTQSPTHSDDRHNHQHVEDESTPYSEMTELENQQQAVIRFQAGGDGSRSESKGGASELVTAVNVVCNVIGAGILSLPTGFADSSLIIGIFLLIGNASLTFLNLYFIIAVSEHLRIYDYGTVLRRGLGERGATVALVVLTIFPGSALVAYARVIADAMPPVLVDFFGASGFITTPGCWILIGGVVFFALSCRRTLSELFISSIFGILTIMFAVLCVVIRFFDGSYADNLKPASVEDGFRPFYVNIELFKTIPLVIFSLSVHNNAPHYYQELQDRTPEKMMNPHDE
jgi:amino acid permease